MLNSNFRNKRIYIFSILYFLIIGLLGAGNLSAKITIMPLGDSITYDNNTDDSRPVGERTGYRQPLWLDLITPPGLPLGYSYNIDFVGSQIAGQSAVPSFDPDNEGHSGWDADGAPNGENIAPNIYNWLVDNPANIILLHIGTNDITTGQDPVGIAAEIDLILTNIDNYEIDNSVEIWVILSRIISRTDSLAGSTTTLNDEIQLMANARIAIGDKLIVVDMENDAGLIYSEDTTFPYDGGDMYDHLHPNESGYAKMATTWFEDGLALILPIADAGPDQGAIEGNTVQLDGTSSIVPQLPIGSFSVVWDQLSGPIVNLSDANSLSTTFSAPSVSACSILQFKLSITDGYITDEDIVDVVVNDIDSPTGNDCYSTQELEAEDGNIELPMEIEADPTASAGNFVHLPSGSNAGSATYQFTTTADTGTYVVWTRVLAPTSSDNSFFVTMDDESRYSWHIQNISVDWQWNQIGIWDQFDNSLVQDPAIYTLNSGQHALIIEGRESGTILDKIMITNDLNFTPYCVADGEPDEDVDGVDLEDVISSGSIGIKMIANEFGRINCQ